MSPSGEGTDDGDDEWRYSLEDLDDLDDETDDGQDHGGVAEESAEADETSGGAGVAGSFGPSGSIEPGDIDLENAAFVLLGVLLALAVAGRYVFFVV